MISVVWYLHQAPDTVSFSLLRGFFFFFLSTEDGSTSIRNTSAPFPVPICPACLALVPLATLAVTPHLGILFLPSTEVHPI